MAFRFRPCGVQVPGATTVRSMRLGGDVAGEVHRSMQGQWAAVSGRRQRLAACRQAQASPACAPPPSCLDVVKLVQYALPGAAAVVAQSCAHAVLPLGGHQGGGGKAVCDDLRAGGRRGRGGAVRACAGERNQLHQAVVRSHAWPSRRQPLARALPGTQRACPSPSRRALKRRRAPAAGAARPARAPAPSGGRAAAPWPSRGPAGQGPAITGALTDLSKRASGPGVAAAWPSCVCGARRFSSGAPGRRGCGAPAPAAGSLRQAQRPAAV